MKLLHDISKDKLMILVTHNYEQVEPYATRKITMHDGKMIEDKIITPIQVKEENENVVQPKNMKGRNKIRLGIRNTFNILPKFLLLFSVYLFLCFAVLGGYSSIKKQQYEQSKLGHNFYFNDTGDKRIIIKKKDKGMLTKQDYEDIKTIPNVDTIVEEDLTLDKYFSVHGDRYGFPAQIADWESAPEEVNIGRRPENENEAILEIPKDYMPMSQIQDNILNKEFEFRDTTNWIEAFENKLKIVGIVTNKEKVGFSNHIIVYVSTPRMKDTRKVINTTYSKLEVEFNNHILEIGGQYRVVPNKRVPQGKVYVFEELNYMAKNNNCKNQNINLKVKNQYYTDNITLTIDKIYLKRNIKQLLGIEEYNAFQSIFYMNDNDYYQLFDKGNYQSSVFINNEKEVQETIQALENKGYQTLYIKDTLINDMGEAKVITDAITIVVTVIVMAALFFLSYFIIKIILKSRNVYYSTIRILGATRKNAKQLLKIELMTVLNIAYMFVILMNILIQKQIIKQSFIQDLLSYIQIKDYILLYVVLVFISILISNRYARQLFKKSVMNTYREEV